jgi:CMP-N-acetylneuraminic acid synthetase
MLLQHMETFAIIPARGGSKGVPKKNIKMLGGFPLLAYPIIASKLSLSIERTIVTTDSEEIAEIARKFGAETPFLRPAEISGDTSTDLDFMNHAINWFKDNEGSVPEYWIELRATTPLRKPADVEAALKLIKVHPEATSLRSGHEIRESPYKLFGIKDNYFVGLFPDDPRPEYYNLPRQFFPPVYQPDGYVDILKTSYITAHKRQHGDKMLAYPSPDTGEVDGPNDFAFIEYKLETESWEIYNYLKKNFS